MVAGPTRRCIRTARRFGDVHVAGLRDDSEMFTSQDSETIRRCSRRRTPRRFGDVHLAGLRDDSAMSDHEVTSQAAMPPGPPPSSFLPKSTLKRRSSACGRFVELRVAGRQPETDVSAVRRRRSAPMGVRHSTFVISIRTHFGMSGTSRAPDDVVGSYHGSSVARRSVSERWISSFSFPYADRSDSVSVYRRVGPVLPRVTSSIGSCVRSISPEPS